MRIRQVQIKNIETISNDCLTAAWRYADIQVKLSAYSQISICLADKFLFGNTHDTIPLTVMPHPKRQHNRQ